MSSDQMPGNVDAKAKRPYAAPVLVKESHKITESGKATNAAENPPYAGPVS